jgi:hypothetical protein
MIIVIILSVFLLTGIILIVILLRDTHLSDILLIVILLSVILPSINDLLGVLKRTFKLNHDRRLVNDP